MPPFRKPNLVTLRRQDLSQPWGFRLAGGVNQGQPFHVQKVIPESIAYRHGLQEGDLLVRIGNITLKGLTHEEVQEIILRCFNTIDLFVIRNPESESSENQIQSQNVVNRQQYSPYQTDSGPKSLTEQVLNRMVEKDVYCSTDFMDYSNTSTPPLQQQFYVKEREMYEYNEYSSPSLSKSPQSPVQRPLSSGRPFSPVVSPTNISYHKPGEQQWMSSQTQPKDMRVFGASPRARSQSPGPQSVGGPKDGQKDARVFGVRQRAQSPVLNGSRPTTTTSQTWSPTQETFQKETKVMKVMSSPSENLQNIPKLNQNEVNQRQLNQSRDKQFFGQNKQRSDSFKNPGFDRPETGRPLNDRRVFANWKQKMGGSLDSQPHWKEPLPQLKTVRPEVNQLLPSHTKKQQTYIVQTPPTERNARPPPTGTLRRRIQPVWPPADYQGRPIPRSGFNRGESPSRKYEWPPSREGSVDRENYENGITSPRMRYSTPPPGAYWKGESDTPRGQRGYTPTRRVKNSEWPPKSNATPAGRSGYRPDFAQSLPGSRRESQTLDSSDLYVFTMNRRIPQTYRAPPNTQYFDQSYHTGYETD